MSDMHDLTEQAPEAIDAASMPPLTLPEIHQNGMLLARIDAMAESTLGVTKAERIDGTLGEACEPAVTLTLELPESLRRALLRAAAFGNCSTSEVAVRALSSYSGDVQSALGD